MAAEPSLLALVLDDPLAPRILAWWKATAPQGAANGPAFARLTPAHVAQLCRVVFATEAEAAASLERLELAGCLGPDGGISETGAKWLGSHVAERLAPRSKKRPRDRGGKGLVVVAALAAVLALTLAMGAGVRSQARALQSPTSPS